MQIRKPCAFLPVPAPGRIAALAFIERKSCPLATLLTLVLSLGVDLVLIVAVVT